MQTLTDSSSLWTTSHSGSRDLWYKYAATRLLSAASIVCHTRACVNTTRRPGYEDQPLHCVNRQDSYTTPSTTQDQKRVCCTRPPSNPMCAANLAGLARVVLPGVIQQRGLQIHLVDGDVHMVHQEAQVHEHLQQAAVTSLGCRTPRDHWE